MTDRTRYALVGAGNRAQMYIDAITERFADRADLVAWSDPNPGRLDYYEERLADRSVPAPIRYGPDRLASMIAEQDVQTVVVTSPDVTHAAVIVGCLQAGADVIVEKPLTVDAAGCVAISAAVAETGRRVTVTFNYRYSPRNTALKQVVASGRIGAVTSVHFEWVLDTVHGADYFRRWHRDKTNSGGLLVHKSTHHFDLVNWWLGDTPERVYARGGLRFYGAENARRRGLTARPARGTGTTGDPFALDLRADERLRRLYLDAERHDGYLRDRDVFDEGITIEDNLAVLVDYAGGPVLTYSLNAHGPWEGYRVAINGTAGRAELQVVERGAVLVDEDGRAVLDPSVTEPNGQPDRLRPRGEQLTVQRHWERAQEVPISAGTGGHGGGDAVLLADLFSGEEITDPLGRPAGHLDGIRSVAVGIAGNLSLTT
ncbi:MAG TPA: Gfo/Idh/MocA family oxidoreductase, partial [Pseudonocardia sp.]|nr:Gfo/Idh/MocA family oxidoreductase [Pseudonocardia sp.]